jgi:hypothetical protein
MVTVWEGDCPSSVEEGWRAQAKARSFLSFRADGVVLFRVNQKSFSCMNHHPVCAFGAATPPGQEGQSPIPPVARQRSLALPSESLPR